MCRPEKLLAADFNSKMAVRHYSRCSVKLGEMKLQKYSLKQGDSQQKPTQFDEM